MQIYKQNVTPSDATAKIKPQRLGKSHVIPNFANKSHIMNKIYAIISTVITALLCCSCGDNDDFRVLGTIENLGTQNLRVAYANESAVVMLTTTAIDGKFSFTGKASKETMLEIFTTDRAPLGVLTVKNGQSLDVKIDRTNPYNVTVKGNKVSEEISRFMRDNSETLSTGSPAQINDIVARYVESHTNSIASTILLLRQFDSYGHEAEADSLFKLIEPKARPDYLVSGIISVLENQIKYNSGQPVQAMNLFTEGDSLMAYNPTRSTASLLTFTRERTDSMTQTLRKLTAKYKKKQLQLVDIALHPDTAAWHNAIKADSAKWIHAWVPGALSNPALSQLRLPRLPYYIVADSTGRQIYRGASITQAATVAETAAANKQVP